MKYIITNPREIGIKTSYIRDMKTLDEVSIWKREIKENGGERFPGETGMLLEVEARLAVEGRRK